MADRGLTIRDAAQFAGVGSSVVQGWLSGANPHDLQAVARLAQRLGVPFKSMLLGENDGPEKPRSIAEMYDEVDLFEGLCKVSIKKLVEKKAK